MCANLRAPPSGRAIAAIVSGLLELRVVPAGELLDGRRWALDGRRRTQRPRLSARSVGASSPARLASGRRRP